MIYLLTNKIDDNYRHFFFHNNKIYASSYFHIINMLRYVNLYAFYENGKITEYEYIGLSFPPKTICELPPTLNIIEYAHTSRIIKILNIYVDEIIFNNVQ